MAVLKPCTCKEAITLWEKAHEDTPAAEAVVVELQFQWPPIEKMDGVLSTLVACEKLSLSSNMIDKIVGIAGMKSLKILSLGRNNIKALSGIETVSDTLEELWISYNLIDKLKGIGALKSLRVLYMSNNLVKEWVEFNRLQDCPSLKDLVFIGNPICENQPDVETWRTQAATRLQQITKLDGMTRRPTSCKEAIANWEKAHEGLRADEAVVVELQFQWPPIEKMDGALSTLVACEKLSLSSNMIDKIAGIGGLKNLKILSLGRNNIKSLAGIETVAETLEELWISYNNIEKLNGIEVMKFLRVLYMSNNLINDWSELDRLQNCSALRDLVLVGNPICESQPNVEAWRAQATAHLKQIDKLDGQPIVVGVVQEAEFRCSE